MKSLFLMLSLSVFAPAPTSAESRCSESSRVAVEVLGSGGPIADDDRAGSGYLLWIDGRARVLVDAGAGVFLRFAEAGARFDDIDVILVSHFHADHVSDLIALLKSGYFSERTRPILVAGPAGNDIFPGMAEFLNANLAAGSGAYRYLRGYLDGSGELSKIDSVEIDVEANQTTAIAMTSDYAVKAVPVHHGHVPAAGYVVSVNGKTVVFGGDQSAFSNVFDETLRESSPDLLIAHHAIPGGPGQPRGLHRDPAAIGALAQSSKARRLVLSHNMQRALREWKDSFKTIRGVYAGPVEIAEDHSCYPLTPE